MSKSTQPQAASGRAASDRRSKAPRRFRRHGDAPANWQYRDGRPRWIPSPALRKAGWKARDLKDAAGAFLSEGLSRDAARDINAAVAAWRRGESVPAELAAIAPPGAWWSEDQSAPLPVATDRLAVGRLMDAFLDSPEIKGAVDARGVRTGGKAPATQKNYRLGLKRLVDALAGWAQLPDRNDPAALADHARAVAIVRAAHITTLRPQETPAGMVNLLRSAYWALHAAAGQHQAYSVMAAASAFLRWCQQHQSETIRQSWAGDVSRETPPGRVRPWSPEEFTAMVEAADRLGLRSIGDSIVLGLDLSWSQVDRLKLTWAQVDNGRVFTARQKTGRVGGTPLTSLGRARVAAIVARQSKMDARPMHVVVCETTGRAWHRKSYGDAFAQVRLEAAKACPSVLDGAGGNPKHLGVWDADLRDTAFTWMKNAGVDDDGIASRTLQGRDYIGTLGDRHYGQIGPEIADRARDQLDAYFRKRGLVA